MRRMFEFMCEDGHITEKYIGYETVCVPCDCCDKDANRIISAPRIELDGTDPIYVSAYDKWAKRHEEKAKLERKQNQA
jgi:hypothetical protein